MKVMYSLNEIGLLPSAKPSPVKSRKEVNPYVYHFNSGKIKLPIFVSPMPCIIDESNFDLFDNSLVQPILPRGTRPEYTISLLSRGKWTAVSLKEFKALFTFNLDEKYKDAVLNGTPMHVCIDMANGHMQELVDAIKKAKSIYGDTLIIMAGNIGHPKMYSELAEAGADYVRVGIGGGNACTTSVLTGIHASLPWLLENINKIKMSMVGKNKPTVVADGGIDTIDKAVKCLALGADMVMMGKMFAQCEEACGEIDTRYTYNWDLESGTTTTTNSWRKYYGNASKEGQKALGGKGNKPSEGISTCVKVNTTLKQLSSDFENALRSAMSYTGATKLNEFVGKVEWAPMSEMEFKSYHKNYES